MLVLSEARDFRFSTQRLRATQRRYRTLFRVLAWLVCGGFTSALAAAVVTKAELTFIGNGYHYLFNSEINSSMARVKAIVSDINQLGRLNDDVVKSELLARYDKSHFKRRMLLKHCILVFCFDLNFVETVELLPNGDVATHIVPGESNFRRGDTLWRITEIDARRTRLTMEATQEPDFWIPPIIGPLLIKRSFVIEVHETVDKLERLANDRLQ